MADNKYTNKFVYYGEEIFNIEGDTVSPQTLLAGSTAHDASGKPINGECTYDSDTSDGTFEAAELLDGKIGYRRGARVRGTMPNNGAVTGKISTKNGSYDIPVGFHDGSGKVAIDPAAVAGLTPQNVRKNVNILGTIGEMEEGAQENAEESKTVTPGKTQQTITPTSGFTCLRQVVVEGIPYKETANAAGGITVTIG